MDNFEREKSLKSIKSDMVDKLHIIVQAIVVMRNKPAEVQHHYQEF